MIRSIAMSIAACAVMAGSAASASETYSAQALPASPAAYTSSVSQKFCSSHASAIACSQGRVRYAAPRGAAGGGVGGSGGFFSTLSIFQIAQLAATLAALGYAIHINNEVSNPVSR
ncbi:MAG TPA: hypothetical protein VN222_10315 [Novosphingobium sp.]|nr:hypothetical protein [Novosphingobium sp.]